MVYLDPKSDIAFKRLFGDITHKNLLISFLNSVLDRKGGETIIDITINDPHNLPLNADDQASAVDVRCTDQNNNQYIVEMQVLSKKNYAARAQYYSSLALIELEAYNRYLDNIRSLKDIQEAGYDTGYGTGYDKGKEEKTIEMAGQCLRLGMDISTIAQITGLSIQHIETLKKSSH